MTNHVVTLVEARMRASRAARASTACMLAAACVALAAMATYLYGWRSGWPATDILAIVVPATVALSVLSLVFDRTLKGRLRAEMALMDATLVTMSNEEGERG